MRRLIFAAFFSFMLSISLNAQIVCPSPVSNEPCPSPEIQGDSVKETVTYWFDIHSFYFIAGNSEMPKKREFSIRAFNKNRDTSVYIVFDDEQKNKPPHVSADKKTFRLFYPSNFLEPITKMLESKERMYFGYRKFENGHIWASIEGYGITGVVKKGN